MVDNWGARGQAKLLIGDLSGARECFRKATDIEPKVAEHWARLAKVDAALRDYDAAVSGFRYACALAPGVAMFHLLLAIALREQNEPLEAIEAFRRASDVDPGNLHAAIGYALMLPPIYAGMEDLHAWRDRYRQGLEWLRARVHLWHERARQVLELEWSNFYLAYQGADDRELQTEYSDFLASLLNKALPGLQSLPPRNVQRDRRLRVAFVSSQFRNCTVGDYFLRWTTDLPREAFHVSVLYTGAMTDARTREYQAHADTFMQLSGNAGAIAKQIRAQALDAVVLPDVGMDALSTLLSNLKLARVQLAAWGHPVTTGSRFMDRYLSCATMEPPGGEAHYREKLALLPGIGVRYRAPARRPSRGMRSHLRLESDAHVYVCPHALYKIHPETDCMLVDIIERDPKAVMVFIAATTKGQTNAFVRRISEAIRKRGLPAKHQIKVLPLLSRADFLELLAASELMLDPPHWSGGNTSLDAFAVDLPVVALGGAEMRGRQTAAMLEVMNVQDLIASDRVDYVRLAVRVATDVAFRSNMAARIRNGKIHLFDQSEPVPALADTIASCCREAGL